MFIQVIAAGQVLEWDQPSALALQVVARAAVTLELSHQGRPVLLTDQHRMALLIAIASSHQRLVLVAEVRHRRRGEAWQVHQGDHGPPWACLS